MSFQPDVAKYSDNEPIEADPSWSFLLITLARQSATEMGVLSEAIQGIAHAMCELAGDELSRVMSPHLDRSVHPSKKRKTDPYCVVIDACMAGNIPLDRALAQIHYYQKNSNNLNRSTYRARLNAKLEMGFWLAGDSASNLIGYIPDFGAAVMGSILEKISPSDHSTT